MLRAQLVGGAHPVFLRTELDELGQVIAASTVHGHFSDSESATPPEKVFGRHLSPYLHTRTPVLSTCE